MGAGKSTVAAMLRELGAKVLDADALVHDEQLRGTVGYSAIVQTFGTKVLGEDKEIDRSKLAAEVFGDPAKLRRDAAGRCVPGRRGYHAALRRASHLERPYLGRLSAAQDDARAARHARDE